MPEGELRREKGTKRFSFFALCARVPFLLPPSLALPSALSLHPLTSPDTIQLTTLTFSPFFPCYVSICLRPRASSCRSSFYLPSPSFLHPLFPSLDFAACYSAFSFVDVSPSSPHLRPPRLSLLPAISQSSLALSLTDNPPVFHARVSLSHSFNVSRILFQPSKRTYDKWLDVGERQHGERKRERGRKKTRERYASVDFSILSSTLAYVKSSLGSIKASFFKLFRATRERF